MVINDDYEKCPDILKKEVEEYLQDHEGATVLGIHIYEGLHPYADKSITENSYIVSLEWGNLCTSMMYSTCTDGAPWHNRGVEKSSMIYAEILNIVNNNKYLKLRITEQL